MYVHAGNTLHYGCFLFFNVYEYKKGEVQSNCTHPTPPPLPLKGPQIVKIPPPPIKYYSDRK